jgi:hypothetical protein
MAYSNFVREVATRSTKRRADAKYMSPEELLVRLLGGRC